MRQIWKNHASTFYNYSTGEKRSPFPRMALTTVAAVVFEFLFTVPSDNFLGAVITVQSILVGFSFNALFFLINNQSTKPIETDVIEIQNKQERLTKLSKELFYNVTYFNLVALICLVTSLICLLSSFDGLSFWRFSYDHGLKYQLNLSFDYDLTRIVLRSVLYFILYATIIDSLMSILRVVSRITFFFERKLEI